MSVWWKIQEKRRKKQSQPNFSSCLRPLIHCNESTWSSSQPIPDVVQFPRPFGMDSILRRIHLWMMSSTSSLLLTGAPGSGKTMSIMYVTSTYSIQVLMVDAAQLTTGTQIREYLDIMLHDGSCFDEEKAILIVEQADCLSSEAWRVCMAMAYRVVFVATNPIGRVMSRCSTKAQHIVCPPLSTRILEHIARTTSVHPLSQQQLLNVITDAGGDGRKAALQAQFTSLIHTDSASSPEHKRDYQKYHLQRFNSICAVDEWCTTRIYLDILETTFWNADDLTREYTSCMSELTA